MADHKTPDQRVIELMEELGDDSSQPHEIEFFLYFPTISAAEQSAVELNKTGFETEIQPGVHDNNVLLLAMKTIAPDEILLRELRMYLEQLANASGGEYDGWGTGLAI
ncbi:MAG: Regulator of ribonuclease activity B [Candidatus Marinimicrobia bacterium]|nr:Regulator of ribonuclease activity B [Candidatus Neomarinimicrobiota bacterium]